eukprot:6459512-Amphidinium_carterae.1
MMAIQGHLLPPSAPRKANTLHGTPTTWLISCHLQPPGKSTHCTAQPPSALMSDAMDAISSSISLLVMLDEVPFTSASLKWIVLRPRSLVVQVDLASTAGSNAASPTACRFYLLHLTNKCSGMPTDITLTG